MIIPSLFTKSNQIKSKTLFHFEFGDSKIANISEEINLQVKNNR